VQKQWGKAKSKQVLPSHFQLTSRGMEACDTSKHLHTTHEIKYKYLVTVTQKVSKLCEKKHFGSKFAVY
jgi:ribosomal protein L32